MCIIKMSLLHIMIVGILTGTQATHAMRPPADKPIKQLSFEQRLVLNRRLILAARTGDIKTVKKALKNGANIDSVNFHGETALMRAAYHGHTKVTQILARAKANLNAWHSSKSSALCGAVSKNYIQTAQALIKAKADLNLSTVAGYTALMNSATEGRTNMVQLLLNAGADMTPIDHQGRAALQLATEHGHENIHHAIMAEAAKRADIRAQLAAEKSFKSDAGQYLAHGPLGIKALVAVIFADYHADQMSISDEMIQAEKERRLRSEKKALTKKAIYLKERQKTREMAQSVVVSIINNAIAQIFS